MDGRRKAARVGLVSEVRIQQTGPEASEIIARGADLGEGGIGLLANDPIQVGEEVALQIAVPDSQTPISVKGRVVWQQSATSGFRLGIQFQEVESLSQARILQLVTERLAPLPAATAAQAGLSAVPPAPPEQSESGEGATQAGLSVQQADVQPATPSHAASTPPAKPLRARRSLLTILLAVVALALFLQNAGLRRSIQELKATVAALQTK